MSSDSVTGAQRTADAADNRSSTDVATPPPPRAVSSGQPHLRNGPPRHEARFILYMKKRQGSQRKPVGGLSPRYGLGFLWWAIERADPRTSRFSLLEQRVAGCPRDRSLGLWQRRGGIWMGIGAKPAAKL